MRRCLILLTFVLAAGSLCAEDSKPAWNITGLTVSPLNDEFRTLIFRASHGSEVAYSASLKVVLTTVSSSFVAENKLAILGEAGNAQAVVIYDLEKRQESDWFFCYQPRRISETWIAYVEYYPSHSTGNPIDVVMIYDLGRSSIDNRLQESDRSQPKDQMRYPIRVGVPVYPDSNARERSYNNEEASPNNSLQILGPPFFLLLSSKQLIFLGSSGSDYSNYVTTLISVDLAKGLDNARSQTIAIPFDQLPKRKENPDFLTALKLEEAGPMAVRIMLPKADYGVDSLLVNIPEPAP
jgi:hypothetical protein